MAKLPVSKIHKAVDNGDDMVEVFVESMNEGGNSVEAFMSHVVDHAKEIQADNYRMTDSSYYEFTDEIDTDDEEFMSMPQVQAILKAIPHVDMENTDIKHAIDVLASGELLEAETDTKLKNLKLSDIPSDYEKRKYAAQTSKKNEEVSPDLPTTNQRTERMLNLIRANNPAAKNDFEAILLSLAKAKKNLNNDEDQADIAALRQDVDGLKLLVNQMTAKVDGLNESASLITEAQFDEAAGKKDACYHKVKSRYKVWPSAYASGALVQCRKKGAKNWGNSKKK